MNRRSPAIATAVSMLTRHFRQRCARRGCSRLPTPSTLARVLHEFWKETRADPWLAPRGTSGWDLHRNVGKKKGERRENLSRTESGARDASTETYLDLLLRHILGLQRVSLCASKDSL